MNDQLEDNIQQLNNIYGRRQSDLDVRTAWYEERFKNLQNSIKELINESNANSLAIETLKNNVQQFLDKIVKIEEVRKTIFGNGDSDGLKTKVNFLVKNEERRNKLTTMLIVGFFVNFISLLFNIALHFITK